MVSPSTQYSGKILEGCLNEKFVIITISLIQVASFKKKESSCFLENLLKVLILCSVQATFIYTIHLLELIFTVDIYCGGVY